jgi:hypothetical protein
MIRSSLLLAVAVVVMAGSAWAQRPPIELNFYADYVWTSSISASVQDESGIRNGDFDIKDNPAFGIAVDFEVRPGTQIELLYQRQDSEMTFRDAATKQTETVTDMASSYYHIGALQGFRRGKTLPFTGLTLGASSFDPQGSGRETEWKFSFAFHAGAKVYLSERIGLRFHGRVFASFLDASAGLWAGTGGAGVAIGGSALWQWDLGGGLIILL